MRPLKELILPLIHLSLLELGTICYDDRHYLLTVYLFTQRNLLFRLLNFATLSRLQDNHSFLSFNLSKITRKKNSQNYILFYHNIIAMREIHEQY